MTFFLIRYDREAGRIIDMRTFASDEGDVAARELRRAETAASGRIEVVMLHGECVDDLKRTHGRYFKTVREIISG